MTSNINPKALESTTQVVFQFITNRGVPVCEYGDQETAEAWHAKKMESMPEYASQLIAVKKTVTTTFETL